MEQKQDIFDRIMSLRLLRPLNPFYCKYKEPLLYLFFGGLTTLLSIFLFWLFAHPISLAPLIANVASWVLSVAFAYVTNRAWVFADKAHGARGVIGEAAAFTAGRLATLALEELLLWLGIDLLSFPDMPVKIAASVLVIIGNYVISKWLVFKQR